MSSDSDLDIETAIPKKIIKKPPKNAEKETKERNETSKKVSTKEMLCETLKALNSRKGVSLHAVRKHMTEKYDVDTKKIDYLIKKTMRSLIEDGTIVQTTGIGASGSFKLAPKKSGKSMEKNTETPKDLTDKPPKPKTTKVKTKKSETKTADVIKPTLESPRRLNKIPTDKKVKKKSKNEEGSEKKSKSVKIAKGSQTTSKNISIKRRKSVGSIIKPPKMKPKKA